MDLTIDVTGQAGYSGYSRVICHVRLVYSLIDHALFQVSREYIKISVLQISGVEPLRKRDIRTALWHPGRSCQTPFAHWPAFDDLSGCHLRIK